MNPESTVIAREPRSPYVAAPDQLAHLYHADAIRRCAAFIIDLFGAAICFLAGIAVVYFLFEGLLLLGKLVVSLLFYLLRVLELSESNPFVVLFLLVFGVLSIFGPMAIQSHRPQLYFMYMLFLLQGGLTAVWLYHARMESSRFCATPGKLLFSLIVSDRYGRRLTISRATARFVVRFIALPIWPVSLWMMFSDARRQALHDRIAETLVLDRRWVDSSKDAAGLEDESR